MEIKGFVDSKELDAYIDETVILVVYKFGGFRERIPVTVTVKEPNAHVAEPFRTILNNHFTGENALDNKYLRKICANCNRAYGFHHSGSEKYPYGYCPGTEGRIGWDQGPGTIFSAKEEAEK